MKKTLAAVAVLGAFAGSALAADVQLYGIVDTGLRYLHSDLDVDSPDYDAKDTFSMESGMQSGSRPGVPTNFPLPRTNAPCPAPRVPATGAAVPQGRTRFPPQSIQPHLPFPFAHRVFAAQENAGTCRQVSAVPPVCFPDRFHRG